MTYLEAESEIIAGFHIEYSGMKFAMFFLAEFLGALFMSALFATMFLGGWNIPLVNSGYFCYSEASRSTWQQWELLAQ